MDWLPEVQMAGDPGLRGHDDVIAQMRAARKSDLAHDQTMTPDDHIVRDVHEVIDLGARADDGRIQGSAVDGALAPISTSLWMTTLPICSTFRWILRRKHSRSRPSRSRVPAWIVTRSPITVRS